MSRTIQSAFEAVESGPVACIDVGSQRCPAVLGKFIGIQGRAVINKIRGAGNYPLEPVVGGKSGGGKLIYRAG